jgi:hypothetical protein
MDRNDAIIKLLPFVVPKQLAVEVEAQMIFLSQ